MSDFKIVGDELDRGRYARSLYNIIGDYYVGENGILHKPLNCTDNESFVMAISAEWGFGKTCFVKMLKDVLNGTGVENKEGKYAFGEHFDRSVVLNPTQVTIYDAWKNDYFNNALEPLFYELASTIFSEEIRDVAKAKKWRAVFDSVRSIGAMSFSNVVKQIDVSQGNVTPESVAAKAGAQALGTAIVDIPETVRETRKFNDVESAKEYIFAGYTDIHNQIKNIRTMLRDEVMKQGKVVIIIDELDRCKPDFAVQTLELVKHLFNIPGIVYIFSLDIVQLQHCVKVVYGNEFDAVGYLERFFDYTTLLPKGSRSALFASIAKEFGVIADDEKPQNAYFDIAEQFSLSAREMKAVLAPFSYLLKYELDGYNDIAKQVYFYLYILKYKEPVRIMHVNSNRTMHILDVQVSQNSEYSNEESDDSIRQKLLRKYPLKLATKQSKIHDVTPFDAIFIVNPIIEESTFKLIEANGSFGKTNYSVKTGFPSTINPEQSLSFVLFNNDLNHLDDESKRYRILEYMYRKIEMYDTVFQKNTVAH